MIERILSLETMRAFSFKNLGVIHNAYLYLRVLTSQLDDILRLWSVERKTLEETLGIRNPKVTTKELVVSASQAPPSPKAKTRFRQISGDGLERDEAYYGALNHLNSDNETRLIQIAAEIEMMGPGGSGHLAHSIDRANYFIDEFDRMSLTLEVENIPGWTNYLQFADRGMRPTFNMIRTTGERLKAAGDRLKALTDVVQVSALIVQSDATRRNTDVLRKIAENIDKLYSSKYRMVSVLGGGAVAIWYALVNALPYAIQHLPNWPF